MRQRERERKAHNLAARPILSFFHITSPLDDPDFTEFVRHTTKRIK
jgi:hypothetical protein